MAQGEWVRRPNNDLTVIFIHGINSSNECWRHKSGTYWPKLLDEFLQADNNLATTGIYVYSYHTGIYSGYYGLPQVVDTLYLALRKDKVINNSQLIFVCHSMGGIIARKFAVKHQYDLKDAGLKAVGFFLIASPSLGSDYANFVSPVSWVVGNLQALALRFSQRNEWLNELDKDFIKLRDKGPLIVKGKELIEARSLFLKFLFFKKQVVEPFSAARYFADPYTVPESDHSTIAAPKSKDDNQHYLLCEFIREFSQASNKNLDKVQPPQKNSETSAQNLTQISIPIRNDTRPIKKVLILAVNPDDTPVLRLDKEVRDICRILKRSPKLHFIVEVRWAVRFEDLQEVLLEFEPDHIHFCGHGTPGQGILLQNSDGMAVPIGADELAGYFQLVPQMESALFLACYSGPQTAGITNVDIIVGIEDIVSDDLAYAYAVAYYQSLAAGELSKRADERGRYAVRLMNQDAESVFVTRSVTNPDRLSKPHKRANQSERNQDAVRILFAAANPEFSNYIQPDEEMRGIYSVMKDALREGKFVIEQNWALRFGDLHESLIDIKPHVVHISSVCTEDSLVFEDEVGKPHSVPFEALSSLFEQFIGIVECVVFTSSHSNTLADRIIDYSRYTVGMPNQVSARESLAFSVGFYRMLGRGYQYEPAYDSGCTEMLAIRVAKDALPQFHTNPRQ